LGVKARAALAWFTRIGIPSSGKIVAPARPSPSRCSTGRFCYAPSLISEELKP
jgi:hypothetical protein